MISLLHSSFIQAGIIAKYDWRSLILFDFILGVRIEKNKKKGSLNRAYFNISFGLSVLNKRAVYLWLMTTAFLNSAPAPSTLMKYIPSRISAVLITHEPLSESWETNLFP